MSAPTSPPDSGPTARGGRAGEFDARATSTSRDADLALVRRKSRAIATAERRHSSRAAPDFSDFPHEIPARDRGSDCLPRAKAPLLLSPLAWRLICQKPPAGHMRRILPRKTALKNLMH
jgi:hypothetical protein